MNREGEIEALIGLAADAGAIAVPIAPRDVVVAEWVRFKCRYGCKGYAKHLSCPPYAPAPAETQAMLAEYEAALLVRFDGVPGHGRFGPDEIPEDFHMFYRDLILWVNTTVHRLEKTAFYDGFYKAFAFGGGPVCVLRGVRGRGAARIRGRVVPPVLQVGGPRPALDGGRGHGRLRNRPKGRLGPADDSVAEPRVRQDRLARRGLDRARPARVVYSPASNASSATAIEIISAGSAPGSTSIPYVSRS